MGNEPNGCYHESMAPTPQHRSGTAYCPAHGRCYYFAGTIATKASAASPSRHLECGAVTIPGPNGGTEITNPTHQLQAYMN